MTIETSHREIKNDAATKKPIDPHDVSNVSIVWREQNNRYRKLTIGTITPRSDGARSRRCENERQIVSFAVAAPTHRASRPEENNSANRA